MGKRRRTGQTLLDELQDGCDVHRVRRLVHKYGVDINHHDSSCLTPFMVACQRASVKIVKYFLELDELDLDVCDMNGDTALHHAGTGRPSRKRLSLVSHLTAHPRCEGLLDRRNNENETPRALFVQLLEESRLEAQRREKERLLQESAARAQQRAEEEAGIEDEWAAKLSSAMESDINDRMAADAWSSQWYDREVQSKDKDKDPALMNDEEYRQYIVQGIHARRYNGQDQRDSKTTWARQQAEAERRKEEAREESARIIREQLAETERRRRQRVTKHAAMYKERCETFFAQKSEWEEASIPLCAIPFPVPSRATDIVASDVLAVVLARIDASGERKALLQEQKRWHPDKWGSQIISKVVESDREEVLARVQAFSRILNQLRQDLEGEK